MAETVHAQRSFRDAERMLKSHRGLPSDSPVFDAVIDLSNLHRNPDHVRTMVHDVTDNYSDRAILEHARVFSISDAPGFFVCTNVFTPVEQQRWVERCLGDYVSPSNIANTNMEFGPLPDALWSRCVRQAAPDAPSEGAECSRKVDRSKDFAPLSAGGYAVLGEARKILERVRWVTLGYHYDWTARRYHSERVSPFPADLSRVATGIARELHLSLVPQAAICNFYRPGNVMGGHQDELELTHEPPVVSLSFGLTCVFLLGSARSKDDPATALFLRSGDVVVMSGPSRLAYHGVPLVFPDSTPDILSEPARMVPPSLVPDLLHVAEAIRLPEPEWRSEAEAEHLHARELARFMSRTRVNINVRQVLAAGQSFPSDETTSMPSDATAGAEYGTS